MSQLISSEDFLDIISGKYFNGNKENKYSHFYRFHRYNKENSDIIVFSDCHFEEEKEENGHWVTDWKTIKGSKRTQIIRNCKNKYSSNSIANKSVDFFNEEISWMKGKLFKKKKDYIDAKRTGRGSIDRVTKEDKEIIWSIYKDYNDKLKAIDKIDFDDYASIALGIIESKEDYVPPFTHVIIDEAQDLSKAQILLISKLVTPETNSISIIADAAQRIYKSGFTWTEVGIEVRGGRTVAFKKNYRNTIQIAKAAKSLLEKEVEQEDFTEIEFSVREGDLPKVCYSENTDDQLKILNKQLKKLKKKNLLSSTIILHRTNYGINEINYFLIENNYATELVNSGGIINYTSDSIKICTMSSIKGLEFDNVFILDLNDDVIPSPKGFIDAQDEFHVSTERRLLYTCMTRAKNKLYLFSSDNPTRYLKEIDPDLLNDISPKESKTFVDDLPF